jgi:hypothetical protein
MNCTNNAEKTATSWKGERLRAEYLEMPGLRLTVEQMRRLCGIERAICSVVLDLLVDEKVLCVRSDGHHARLTTGHHPHPAKPDLRTEQACHEGIVTLPHPALEPDRTGDGVAVAVGRASLPPDAKGRTAASSLAPRHSRLE